MAKETAKQRILSALSKDPITNEQKVVAVNALIYTIIAHFVGANELHNNRTQEQLINLCCPTLSYFYWYRDTFFSKVMTRPNCKEDFWKEKFLSGLPKLFAERMRNKLKVNYNITNPYSQLTYGDLVAEIVVEGINFCNDVKLNLSKKRKVAKKFLEIFVSKLVINQLGILKRKNSGSIIKEGIKKNIEEKGLEGYSIGC
ncbi:hypothetical protein CDL12_15700 [Handroanthus impetiginosus]|uniref:Uncharacterized protein n=1 Tax=Handroanthus impetiginosus TaxID=429701 RepID=A0A2G9H2H5_9LAMI|nr:hypothetical protein CDL12_15700 [Handroanthus impetiginosus]